MTQIKERPILFSGEMVRAILDGRKTQTRRLFKAKNGGVWPNKNDLPGMQQILRNCPYGSPGGRLWVREAWMAPLAYELSSPGEIPSGTPVAYKAGGGTLPALSAGRCRPRIHMPRWAGRILLEVVSVRVEKLGAISEADCVAEGCAGGHGSIPGYAYDATPIEHYRALWDCINGAGDYDKNPWVWVVEFRVLTR